MVIPGLGKLVFAAVGSRTPAIELPLGFPELKPLLCDITA